MMYFPQPMHCHLHELPTIYNTVDNVYCTHVDSHCNSHGEILAPCAAQPARYRVSRSIECVMLRLRQQTPPINIIMNFVEGALQVEQSKTYWSQSGGPVCVAIGAELYHWDHPISQEHYPITGPAHGYNEDMSTSWAPVIHWLVWVVSTIVGKTVVKMSDFMKAVANHKDLVASREFLAVYCWLINALHPVNRTTELVS